MLVVNCFGVCCLLVVVGNLLLSVGCYVSVGCCLFCVEGCLLSAVCNVLLAVCCLVFVVCGLLRAVGCKLSVV